MERSELKIYENRLRQAGLLEHSYLPGDIIGKEVGYISYDSKDVEGNTLFICKGAHFRPQYLSEAIKNGAFAYVSEVQYKEEWGIIPYMIVRDIKKAMVVISETYYRNIWKKLKLVGITGTKGKSTTAYYVKSILDDYEKARGGNETAIISGIDNYDGVIREESHMTTPEAIMLHRHFKNAVDSGIEFLSMEVSSQALKYHRTDGVIFDVGIFMNIGNDHISDVEHPTVKDYENSKLILFDQSRVACISLDDSKCHRFIQRAKASPVTERMITFGLKEGADIFGYDLKPSREGVRFRVRSSDFDREFSINMPGLFNVKNALAAIAAAIGLSIPVDSIERGLQSAKVSGRMEVLGDEEITVFVDYAHNQMSFRTLFEAVKEEYPDKKIFIVFGCPGKKALGRRRELGEIAGKYADICFLTEEDAGEEPVIKILEEIAVHIRKQEGNYEIIEDRGDAIREALSRADAGTVVLITGKGRETRQKRGMEYVDTPSDVDYVEEFFRERKKEKL